MFLRPLTEQERQALSDDDHVPFALACFGLLVRPGEAAPEEVWLRIVDGPVSAITTQFLAWCGDRLAAQGVTTLVLVCDHLAIPQEGA